MVVPAIDAAFDLVTLLKMQPGRHKTKAKETNSRKEILKIFSKANPLSLETNGLSID